MNYLIIALGICVIIFGIYVAVLRVKGRNEKFSKLKPMKNAYVDRAGGIVHSIGYIIIPIVVGFYFIIRG